MTQERYVDAIHSLISERERVFGIENTITNRNTLLTDGAYPLADNQWIKIPDVVCVFVDIRNSTGLSATLHDKSTASIYELFTGTAIRMFHLFKAEYIDIKGDGVFALFSKDQVHRAFAAAMSFKTFAGDSFLRLVKQKLPETLSVGFHMGIDQKTVLVKKLGLKNAEGRDIRQNEVWAGKPINMAAKLAALSNDGELFVSGRFYHNLSQNILVQRSCGCTVGSSARGARVPVWEIVEKPEGSPFDFEKIYKIKTFWCVNHGKKWCEDIIALDTKAYGN